MTTINYLHNGVRLKEIIKAKNLKVDEAVKVLQLGNNQHLHYYYNKKQIKESTLNKFLKLLEIDEKIFFEKTENNVVGKEMALYNVSTHQGRNLHNILNTKGISITALCGQLNISRPTLYTYFKEKELPLSVLLEVAHILEIPVARIKGIDSKEQSFEKDVYLMLEKVNNEIAALKQQFDK